MPVDQYTGLAKAWPIFSQLSPMAVDQFAGVAKLIPWFVLLFFAGGIALTWFIRRRRKNLCCGTCGTRKRVGAKFCHNCGADFAAFGVMEELPATVKKLAITGVTPLNQ